MKLTKDNIGIIMAYSLRSASDRELVEYFRPHLQVFRRAAIHELLKRFSSSSQASEYLIRLLTYHMTHHTIKSVSLPILLLKKGLQHSFIQPKLAALLHGCIGCTQNRLSDKSQQFLEVISHLTEEALPHIFLAQVSCNHLLANRLFEKCMGMQDSMIRLESLLLASNFFDLNQKAQIKLLLTPTRVVKLNSRLQLNIALSLVDNDVMLSSLNLQISTEYVTCDERRETERKYHTTMNFSNVPRKFFISSYWRRINAYYRGITLERLIAMLYSHNTQYYALYEISTISSMLEPEYCLRVQKEVCNYNLIFPIKNGGSGRNGRGGNIIFSDILPGIWRHLTLTMKDECILLAVIWIQTEHFQKHVDQMICLRKFLNELTTHEISSVLISVLRLVRSYDIHNPSMNLDAIIIGVVMALDTLQDYLLDSDRLRLLDQISEWLRSEDGHCKKAAAWALSKIHKIYQSNQKILLIELLNRNCIIQDRFVFIHSCISLNTIQPGAITQENARECLEIFDNNYNDTNFDEISNLMLDHLREFYVVLSPNVQSSLVKKVLAKMTQTYSRHYEAGCALLSRIKDLLNAEHCEQFMSIMSEQFVSRYEISNLNEKNEFIQSVIRLRQSPIIIEAIVAAYIKKPEFSKYLPESLLCVLYQTLPIQEIQKEFKRMMINNDGLNHARLFSHSKFRFFSNRWHETSLLFRKNAISHLIKCSIRHDLFDYASLAITIMLWPKIISARQDVIHSKLSIKPYKLL